MGKLPHQFTAITFYRQHCAQSKPAGI